MKAWKIWLLRPTNYHAYGLFDSLQKCFYTDPHALRIVYLHKPHDLRSTPMHIYCLNLSSMEGQPSAYPDYSRDPCDSVSVESLDPVHPYGHPYYDPPEQREHLEDFVDALFRYCNSDHATYSTASLGSFGPSTDSKKHSFLGSTSNADSTLMLHVESVRSYGSKDLIPYSLHPDHHDVTHLHYQVLLARPPKCRTSENTMTIPIAEELYMLRTKQDAMRSCLTCILHHLVTTSLPSASCFIFFVTMEIIVRIALPIVVANATEEHLQPILSLVLKYL